MSQFRFGGFNMLPDVVKNLLIINGLFFLATMVLESSFGIDLTGKLALYYFDSDKFKPYQFVSHLFMHGSFWHLFSNMFALWMFGNALENVWGPKKFLTFYLVTGLGAAALHSAITAYEVFNLSAACSAYANNPSIEAFHEFIKTHLPAYLKSSYMNFLDEWMNTPTSGEYARESVKAVQKIMELKQDVPTVGASGAVFGVLLGYGMLFPNTVIYLNFLFPVKAKYFVLFYGLFELYAGVQSFEGDNIAHFAHLGGMIFGFFLIRYWRTQKTNFL